MPYPPADNRHAHLPLIRQDATFKRRGHQVWVPPPGRGGRQRFSTEFKDRLTAAESSSRRQPPPPPGIEPHLVLKLPVAAGANLAALTKQLEEVGVRVVSIEPNRAVVAFREDQDLSAFRGALDEYARGPRISEQTGKQLKTTPYDVFEYVNADQVDLWSRYDRIGPRLRDAIGGTGKGIDPTRRYIVEAELWHRGTEALARAAVDEVKQFIGIPSKDEKVFDWYIGDELCLVKVAILGAKLDRLLDLAIVADVDLPPTPVFSAPHAAHVTPRDFPTPPAPDPNGPRLCIVDSGIVSGHPLLRANVGHEESVLSGSNSPADGHGHGTRVGGIAVFGDVRACFATGEFSSPITLFSARILNERNEFDDEKLIINQIREAIRIFVSPPHDCRIFNLSLGTAAPSSSRHENRQTPWAEALDIAAREFGVLLVVSSGNNANVFAPDTATAEAVTRTYPGLLLEDDSWLADPATSALSITVGALAEHDVVGQRSGPANDDLSNPIARMNEPSPFTRVGPGLAGAVKPDFVAYGGNAVWMGTANIRRIRQEPGTAVMSLSRMDQPSLFSYDVGTSYAAPRVARAAALVADSLKRDFGTEPHPNLIRATLAISASVPPAATERLQPLDKEATRIICGYGMVDEEIAARSSDRWVTMVVQDTLTLDHFRIYEVPAPPEFKQAPKEKTIRIALAFDPPVRRRRQDYLGTYMDFMLIRGKTPGEIAAAYSRLSPDEEPDKLFGTPHRVQLTPSLAGRGRVKVGKGTLIRSEFRFQREGNNYGPSYFLVVRAIRRWAPESITTQSFALAASLIADEPSLYQRVRARIQQRERIRR